MPKQPREKPERWTARRLLVWMAEAFAARSLDSPRLMAEMIVAHVIASVSPWLIN